MKTIEDGKKKIEQICTLLREETLEPAQQEAQTLIKSARLQAEHIVADAHKEAAKLLTEAKASIERERGVFQSSLHQAAQQSVEALRETIENKFFKDNLYSLVENGVSDPKVIANFINAIVKAIEKEGTAADLTALIPSAVTPRQVNELLLQDVLKVLKNQSVTVGNFSGGAQIKLNNKKVTIVMSADAVKELLANHLVRRDFRAIVFNS